MSPTRRQPKVAVVVGGQRDLSLASSVIEELGPEECTVYAIDSGQEVLGLPRGVELRLFEHLPDMPGYLRNLEAEVEGCEYLLALGTLSLSSFQTVRIARKRDRPVAVIVDAFRSVSREEYPNAQAMQADILAHGDAFVVSDVRVGQALRAHGVEEDRICHVARSVDFQRFQVRPDRRQKLRSYLADLVPQESRWILADMQSLQRKGSVYLEALSLWRADHVAGERWHLIVTGSSERCEQLRYQVYDRGLTSWVSFLHQDTGPFIGDLLNAADCVVLGEGRDDLEPEELQRGLNALACGASVLSVTDLIPGTDLKRFQGQVLWQDPTASGLRTGIRSALQVQAVQGSRTQVGRELRDWQREHRKGDDFKQRLIERLERKLLLGARVPEISQGLSGLDSSAGQGQWGDALVKAEELLLRQDLDGDRLAHVMRVKGDALAHGTRYEEAVHCYQECLARTPKDARAYRGLGFVALHSHSHDDALTFFRKSLGIEERDPLTHLGIGLVYRRIGLPEEAVYWLERSVTLDQGRNPSAIVALAQVCQETLATDSALASVERVVDAVGETPVLLLVQGQLLMREGKVREGHELLRRALQSGAGDPTDA